MAFQYSLWKLFVATAAVTLVFAVAHPTELVPTIATFVAAGSLVGLILLGNRAKVGAIWRSVFWTLLGAYIGSLISPSPFLHPPYEFFCGGALIGWGVGAVLNMRRRRNKGS